MKPELPHITTPPLFYYAVAVGLALYLAKKYIAGEGWHFGVFIRKEYAGLINSVVITAAIAYLVPVIVLYASDMPKLSHIAHTYPSLVERVTEVFGGVLGFTGGSIAFDLVPIAYNIPLIGPALKGMVERIRGRKADKMAKDHGIDTKP